MIKFFLSLALIFILSFCAFAQSDSKNQIQNREWPDTAKKIRIFKGTRIINAETNETLKKHTLDFRVTHLFGNMGKESGGGYHNFYGLDQSKDIRIAFDYGITDWWTISVSRSKRHENLEASGKFKIIEQAIDKAPLAISFFANITYSTITKSSFQIYKPSYRYTYATQIVIARKFSPRFSFEIVPCYVHRNLDLDSSDKNDLLALGGGFRWRFTKHTSLIADYFFTPKVNGLTYPRHNPLGTGVEIESGGHLFSVMLTNASGILENDYIPNTTDSWKHGGYKLSFIISRLFKL
ncbi:MAG: hypothetical protein E6H06_20585 [Bacteroidetes bacterium]|nr:MAG: hypothetical protein E6H06_20585 [Bacteroidota bacterium]